MVWEEGRGKREENEIDARFVLVRLQFTPEIGRVSSVRWLGENPATLLAWEL